jgi:hypothetical protein
MGYIQQESCQLSFRAPLNTAVIEYVANTRAFIKRLLFKKQMVTVSKDRSGKEKLHQ